MKESKIPTLEEDEERMSEMMRKDIKPPEEFGEFMEIVARMIREKGERKDAMSK